jgi:hypothetical protein
MVMLPEAKKYIYEVHFQGTATMHGSLSLSLSLSLSVALRSDGSLSMPAAKETA